MSEPPAEPSSPSLDEGSGPEGGSGAEDDHGPGLGGGLERELDELVADLDPHHEEAEPPGAHGELMTEERDRRGPIATSFAVVREFLLVVVIAVVLSLVIKTFLVQAFYIPSPSMESTLVRGDRVIVNKLTPGPFHLKRGDIVVFSDPGDWLGPAPENTSGNPVRRGLRSALIFIGLLPNDSDEHLIKRVIGLPGDHVACCDSKGRVTVNGTAIDEPYVYPGDDPSDKKFSVTVPAGRLWVLGDHRSVSEDARYHLDEDDGMVPIKDVVGKAFVTVWPASRFRLLNRPAGTFSTVPAP